MWMVRCSPEQSGVAYHCPSTTQGTLCCWLRLRLRPHVPSKRRPETPSVVLLWTGEITMRYHCYAMGKVKVCVCTACVRVYVCVGVYSMCVCVCVCVCVCTVCVCVCVLCATNLSAGCCHISPFSIIASGNGQVQGSSMCVCIVMHTLSCVVELARQSDRAWARGFRHVDGIGITYRIFWRQRRTLNTQISPKRMAYIPMTKITVINK